MHFAAVICLNAHLGQNPLPIVAGAANYELDDDCQRMWRLVR
jgi:hypothetical protein